MWFVHVCACVYKYIYIYIYMYVYTYIFVSISIVLVYLAPFSPNSVCVCVFYMCVCMCVCVSAVVGLLLCVGFLSLQSAGASLCWSVWSSHCSGSSCGGAEALGHMGFNSRTWRHGSYSLWASEYGLSSCGTQVIVVLWHMGSSWSRDQTRVPCTGR